MLSPDALMMSHLLGRLSPPRLKLLGVSVLTNTMLLSSAECTVKFEVISRQLLIPL